MPSFLAYLREQSNTASLPPRIVIYGTSKIGKSTFCAAAPDCVFLPLEDGLAGLHDVAAFPLATSYQQALDNLQTLIDHDHDAKTLVIDSIDWLEKLIHRHVAEAHGKSSIEEWAYGKGYVFATDEWIQLLVKLDELRAKKGMMIMLIAHHETKTFNDPLAESYHVYGLKLHKSANEKVQEWADVIGFANYKTFTLTEKTGFAERKRVGGSGERVLHLKQRAGFLAGNRFGMKAEIPLDFSAFDAEFTDKQGRPLVTVLTTSQDSEHDNAN